MLKTLPVSKSAPIALLMALTACGGSDEETQPTEFGGLSGSVLNAPNPVSGVKVTVSGPGGTFRTVTSGAGTYSLTGIPTGDYTIDFCGQGVFDSAGNPIADKINLRLPASRVGTSSNEQKPAFLPEKALGHTVDTAGTQTGTIAAGTIITNPLAGVAIVFAEETTVTFVDSSDTTISITPVPAEQIPVALPSGLAATSLIAIEPAGATFDVRPQITFGNTSGLPEGTQAVPIYQLSYSTGTWVESGTGTVSVGGAAILSDETGGLRGTGWHTTVVETFCETMVTGTVEDTNGQPVTGALVTALNGLTTETDSFGRFTFDNVPLPTDNSEVVVTVVPPTGAGLLPDDSSAIVGMCGSETEMGTISLSIIAVDTTAPTVSSTLPADGSIGVPDNTALNITFDELMSPGSLNSTTLTLSAAGQQLDGQIGVSSMGGQTTATFVPAEALPVDSEIRLQVSGDVMDAAGNTLGESVAVTFNTGADVTGGAITIDVTPDSPAAILPSETLQLSAAVLDAASQAVNGAMPTWSSDTPSVMEVDATGVVTTFLPGSAIISASFGGAVDEVTVTVNTPAIASVVLTGDAPLIAIGSGLSLTAEARDAGANALAGFAFDWTSTDDAIATVDANGSVRGVAAGGPVTITATEPGSAFSAQFALTVVDPATVDSVEVTASASSIGPDTAVQVSAIARDNNQSTVPGVTFDWSSSNESVASVNANGLVSAVGAGSVQIVATADGSQQVMGTVDIEVYPYEPTVVRLLRGNEGRSAYDYIPVILHDAVTGEYIGSQLAQEDGIADFGFTDVERVTVSYSSFENGFYAFTVVDVPVGRMTFTVEHDPSSNLGVQVSVPKGPDVVSATSGGFAVSVPTSANSSQGSASFSIPAYDSQTSPVLGVAYDTSDPSLGILAGDFDPRNGPNASEGLDAFLTLSASAVSSIPFTTSSVATFTGSRFRKDGLLYKQPSGVIAPVESGNANSVAPEGADRYAYRFEAIDALTSTRQARELRFNSEPTSLTVGTPSITLTGATFDSETSILSWTAGNTTGYDMGRIRLTEDGYFLDGSDGFTWDIIFPATATSVTIPVTKGLPYLPSSTMEIDVELYNHGDFANYEGFLGAYRATEGRFEQATLAGGDRLDIGILEASSFRFFIGNDAFGALTYDVGDGPITVTTGDQVVIPIGAQVIITATAVNGSLVDDLISNQGTAVGVGTQTATLTIDSNEIGSNIDVYFSSAP